MKINGPDFSIEINVFGDTDPKKMPLTMFHEAVYIDYDNAIKADTEKQAGATCPRYWYIPVTFECIACKNKFDFSIDEQKFWYERLQFFPSITPVRCAPCRKIERKRKLDEQKPKNKTTEPNKAVEPTIMAVTFRAPSSTNCASHDRGSL